MITVIVRDTITKVKKNKTCFGNIGSIYGPTGNQASERRNTPSFNISTAYPIQDPGGTEHFSLSKAQTLSENEASEPEGYLNSRRLFGALCWRGALFSYNLHSAREHSCLPSAG